MPVLGQQVFVQHQLALKVNVKGPGADLGQVRNVVDGGLIVALFIENLLCGLADTVQGLLSADGFGLIDQRLFRSDIHAQPLL